MDVSGFKHYETGNEKFDKEFVVKGNSEANIKVLFSVSRIRFTAPASGIIGKMYSDSGKAVASLKTTDSGLYGQIRIDGTVTGNSLSGTYQTSSNSSSAGASGTVVLTKQ